MSGEVEILSIELRRRGLNKSKLVLCRTAKVRPSTYWRLLRQPGSGNVKTIQKLRNAIEALEIVENQRAR